MSTKKNEINEMIEKDLKKIGGESSAEGVFKKFNTEDPHDFGRTLTPTKAKKKGDEYTDLATIMAKSKKGNRVVRLQLNALTYASLKFQKQEIEEMIVGSDDLNPEVDVTNRFVSRLDIKIGSAGEIATGEAKTARVIKGFSIGKDSTGYLILNSPSLIGEKEGFTLLGNSPDNEQNLILKQYIPEWVYSIANIKTVEGVIVGSFNNELSVQIDTRELITRYVIRELVKNSSGMTVSNIDEYKDYLSVGEIVINKDDIFVAISNIPHKTNIHLEAAKTNFTVANLSLSNDSLGEAFSSRIKTMYADSKYPIDAANLADSSRINKSIRDKVNPEITFIPISMVSGFKNILGRPIADDMSITASNRPSMVPVVALDTALFKTKSETSKYGLLATRWNNSVGATQLDMTTLAETFSKIINTNSVVVVDIANETNKFGLLIDIRRAMLEYVTDGEFKVDEFTVSVETTNNNTAFIIQNEV